MSRPLPPKKEVALALLERSSVHVHLDPRVASVVVPPWFKSQPQLVLQIGLNMPVPIPDLHLDDDGMSCTLSFNRAPFHCVVPWAGIFAMVGEDGRGMVWPDDVPVEVSRQARPVQVAPAPKESSPENGKPEAPPRRGPRRIADAAADDSSAAKKKKGGAAKRPRIVPSPEEPRARLAAVPPVAAGTSDARNPLRDVTATPSQPLGAGPQRPKKELPPYLRVVK